MNNVKSLDELDQTGHVNFALGQHDISDIFLIPDSLYGRNEEQQLLFNSFEVARRGKNPIPQFYILKIYLCEGVPQMLLLSGESGSGKSALVKNIRRKLMFKNAFFITGKSDQYKRDIPYQSVSEAFSDLIQ